MCRVQMTKLVLVLSLACLPVVGCNVAPAFRDRQAPRGPVTRADKPAGISEEEINRDLVTVDGEEVDLVEAVLTHRARYHRALAKLHNYYRDRGFATKESWAAFEQEGLRRVKAFRYLMDAEVPADNLTASESLAGADELFEKALNLMKRGGYGIPGIYDQDRMVEAAREFRHVIEDYPSSNKIDDAAFYLGEIHKDYFPNQETIAVRWYERAWTWNPDIRRPARFNAATIYDYQLHDRARALELYHAVLDKEAFDVPNVRTATNRIEELTRNARTARDDG